MWDMELWFCLPRVSWAALCSHHRCAGIEDLQTQELTPGSMSGVFTGAPLPRHDWWFIQLISGSNLSRGAADTAGPKPPSWVASFLWPKVFTLNHTVDISIRVAQDPHKNKSTFLFQPLTALVTLSQRKQPKGLERSSQETRTKSRLPLRRGWDLHYRAGWLVLLE